VIPDFSRIPAEDYTDPQERDYQLERERLAALDRDIRHGGEGFPSNPPKPRVRWRKVPRLGGGFDQIPEYVKEER
jgi:hypothetical protein